MIVSRHVTVQAADRSAKEQRKYDDNNNYYVINAAKGKYLYAVVRSSKENI